MNAIFLVILFIETRPKLVIVFFYQDKTKKSRYSIG